MGNARSAEAVLLEQTRDKLVVVDESGEFVSLHGAVEEMLGFEPADLAGENAFDYVHPGDRVRVRETFTEVVADGEPRTATERYRHRTADGGYRWIESRFSNVTDPTLGGYVVSSRDVTERVRAEREREATERRLRELTDAASDVLWMFDADFEELLFVNPAYEDVYGLPAADLEGDPRNFMQAVHPEDRERVEAGMAALSAGEPVDMEYRVNPATDYGTWVWVQGEPIEDGDEVVRVVGSARDVTERYRRERQLAVMDTLLRHNIRNDMAVVTGHAELIAEAAGPAAADHAAVIREVGADLVRTADKQREIIELLSDCGERVALDVVVVVEAAVADVTDRWPDAAVRTTLPERAPAEALAALELAVAELVENAVEHGSTSTRSETRGDAVEHGSTSTRSETRGDAGEHGSTSPWRVEDEGAGPDAGDGTPDVEVTVERRGGDVAVRVADGGPPIPVADAAVLRGEEALDSVYHSSGLGLWLVHWAVDLSGGRVEVERVDGGNAVTLLVPAADD